ncbi:MAG: sigma-70 family RNA polymerase sigma factor [Planctomycetes bacterium]|nr:sigma-70 family RNA polymerase sigma factor [Planctomycetota bacterium]
MSHKNWNTSHTLLERAKQDSNNDIWEEFVVCYEPFIFHILNTFSVPHSSQADLSQKVLLRMFQSLKTYDSSKGKFRTWLGVVVKNTVFSYYNEQKRRSQHEKKIEEMGADHLALHTQESELETLIEEEWQLWVGSKALEAIRPHFSAAALKAFELSLQGMDNDRIASELSVKKTSVAELKARVKRKYIHEVRSLIQSLER